MIRRMALSPNLADLCDLLGGVLKTGLMPPQCGIVFSGGT